jgi:hypothetical protein
MFLFFHSYGFFISASALLFAIYALNSSSFLYCSRRLASCSAYFLYYSASIYSFHNLDYSSAILCLSVSNCYSLIRSFSTAASASATICFLSASACSHSCLSCSSKSSYSCYLYASSYYFLRSSSFFCSACYSFSSLFCSISAIFALNAAFFYSCFTLASSSSILYFSASSAKA